MIKLVTGAVLGPQYVSSQDRPDRDQLSPIENPFGFYSLPGGGFYTRPADMITDEQHVWLLYPKPHAKLLLVGSKPIWDELRSRFSAGEGLDWGRIVKRYDLDGVVFKVLPEGSDGPLTPFVWWCKWSFDRVERVKQEVTV